MTVKNGIRYVALFAVGLGMVILIYPALHEGGHALVAWLMGIPVVEAQVLSAPRVQCDLRNATAVATECVGWGGVVLPLLLSFLCRPRRFWVWYAVFVWRCIAVFACVLAGVSTVLFVCGAPMPDDDMTRLLVLFPHRWRGYLLLSSALSAFGVAWLVRDHPFRRCAAYFV